MYVQEFDVAPTPFPNGIRIDPVDTDHPEHVQVGKHHMAAGFQFHGLTLGTFAALFFELQVVHFPVRYLVEPDLVSDMVFNGHGVYASGCTGIRYVGPGPGAGVGSPDVFKGSAAAVGDPEAPVLGVPGFAGVSGAWGRDAGHRGSGGRGGGAQRGGGGMGGI